MEPISIITNLISGLIGGNLTGAALKDKSLGAIGNSITGLIGGAAGGYLATILGFLNTLGLADMSVGSILANVGSGLVGGGVLTAIVGFIKKMMTK